MVSTLAWKARDVTSISALGAICPIFIICRILVAVSWILCKLCGAIYLLKLSWMYVSLLYAYMKSSFPKRAKRQSKNQGCNGNAKFGDHVLEKNFS